MLKHFQISNRDIHPLQTAIMNVPSMQRKGKISLSDNHQDSYNCLTVASKCDNLKTAIEDPRNANNIFHNTRSYTRCNKEGLARHLKQWYRQFFVVAASIQHCDVKIKRILAIFSSKYLLVENFNFERPLARYL